jgi:hypothetical protein
VLPLACVENSGFVPLASGPQHLTGDGHHRRIGLIAPEDANDIEEPQIDAGVADRHFRNVELDRFV